jgi:CHASE2 domain-containing sensor protein
MYARNLFTSFLNRAREYRHPDGALRVRLACAIFAFCAGLALLSAGVWGGAIPMAASVLIFFYRSARRHRDQS